MRIIDFRRDHDGVAGVVAALIAALSLEVTSEADAYAYFEKLRWADGATCAHCASANVYFIEPANGVSRDLRERVRESSVACGVAVTAKSSSASLRTRSCTAPKSPLRIWLMVIFELCSSKNGVAAREVERKYGVAARSAWFMLHRIREAMSHDDFTLFSGDVVADETYIGGDPKNRHADKRPSASRSH